jgi:hypothetical protein
MLVDGHLINEGMDIIRYLDWKLEEIAKTELVVTGIIIGSSARIELTKACQKVMGQPDNPEETVNRFRNILLIEDGNNKDRIEVVSGMNAVRPQEGNPFLKLKRVGRV